MLAQKSRENERGSREDRETCGATNLQVRSSPLRDDDAVAAEPAEGAAAPGRVQGAEGSLAVFKCPSLVGSVCGVRAGRGRVGEWVSE